MAGHSDVGVILSNFVRSAKRGGPQITQMSSNARLKSVMGNFLMFLFLKTQLTAQSHILLVCI